MSKKTKLSQKQKKKNRKKYLDTLKKRYAVYRSLGYTTEESRQLKFRELDVSTIQLDKKGKVIKKRSFKKVVDYTLVERFRIDNQHIKNDYKEINTTNDTVYSPWGVLTHDDRYKDDTAKVAKHLQRKHGLSNDQAYYFLYVMTQSGMTYQETMTQLLTNKEFEIYDQTKKERR